MQPIKVFPRIRQYEAMRVPYLNDKGVWDGFQEWLRNSSDGYIDEGDVIVDGQIATCGEWILIPHSGKCLVVSNDTFENEWL